MAPWHPLILWCDSARSRTRRSQNNRLKLIHYTGQGICAFISSRRNRQLPFRQVCASILSASNVMRTSVTPPHAIALTPSGIAQRLADIVAQRQSLSSDVCLPTCLPCGVQSLRDTVVRYVPCKPTHSICVALNLVPTRRPSLDVDTFTLPCWVLLHCVRRLFPGRESRRETFIGLGQYSVLLDCRLSTPEFMCVAPSPSVYVRPFTAWHNGHSISLRPLFGRVARLPSIEANRTQQVGKPADCYDPNEYHARPGLPNKIQLKVYYF